MYPCVLDGLLWFSDGWTLVQDQLRVSPDPTDALFTTSNGYIGLRGGTREPFGGDGLVLLSGCYETRPYAHPERTFGTPERYQTIVPVADPTVLSIMVDGIPLAAHSGTWLEHLRTLDLRTGCVTTTGRWRSPAGVTVTVRTRRMVSLDTAGVLWRTVEIEPLDDRVGTEVTLEMRANTGNRTFPGEPEALSRAWGGCCGRSLPWPKAASPASSTRRH